MLGGALENLRIVREYFAESLFAVAMRTVALAARSGEARGGAARRAKYDHPLATLSYYVRVYLFGSFGEI